ncbi:hypothetical protein [Paraburkholderia unamae]|uniref:hypothetical protein n=1 Tax=Paraburkholderia unamae TaxID=219649 RepID=UPI001C65A579|nr:hypothetical protein [Paraburkholderia unamae]
MKSARVGCTRNGRAEGGPGRFEGRFYAIRPEPFRPWRRDSFPEPMMATRNWGGAILSVENPANRSIRACVRMFLRLLRFIVDWRIHRRDKKVFKMLLLIKSVFSRLKIAAATKPDQAALSSGAYYSALKG